MTARQVIEAESAKEFMTRKRVAPGLWRIEYRHLDGRRKAVSYNYDVRAVSEEAAIRAADSELEQTLGERSVLFRLHRVTKL